MRTLLAAAALAALAVNAAFAQSPSYPTRPVRLVNGQAAGGSADILGRSVAEPLGKALGQSIVVENRAGAGGNIGTGEVATATPDGYTLLIGYVGTLAVNPWLYKSVPFDPVESFQNIVGLADVPLLLVTRAEFPARTLDELIGVAKTRLLTFGSAGNGTMNHMNGELINTAAGIRTQHVPYKGVAFSVTDVLGGQIDMSYASMPSVVQHIRAGKLKAIAVSSPQRAKALPEVPTMLESKLAPVSVSTWYSLMAPRGTPMAIVMRVNGEVVKILDTPAMRERLDALGAVPWPLGPDQLLATIKEDLARWEKIVKTSGAKID
jgi:tripartite-type tricarboxylate transporter receptor subunit TctC